jgi:hypothetical protein
MTRVIYNTTTGQIEMTMQGYKGPTTQAYIEVNFEFNMNEYKVNLETLELEKL